MAIVRAKGRLGPIITEILQEVLMIELKIREKPGKGGGDAETSPCGCKPETQGSTVPLISIPAPGQGKALPPWATGTIMTPAGPVLTVSTSLTPKDRWEHLKCRVSAFRNAYTLQPGLYAAGKPDRTSDILVTANYKLSFDALRQELGRLDVWILVLDTRGINVWCAAGKGTFGTDELVRRIAGVRLDAIVDHRRIIVPQLGAPGVSGHAVKKATGFTVRYGPVSARDLRAYIDAGYKATKEMRTIRFPLRDRLVLTPMEINPAMKKYFLYAVIVLVFFGLQPSGILFSEALSGGAPFLLLGLGSVAAGAFLTPVLLPFIPSRSFAVKGWIVGTISLFLTLRATGLFAGSPLMIALACLFFPALSSYIALQFTGSTTFTSMAGVKKELRVAVPVYILSLCIAAILLIIIKLREWGIA